MKKETKEVVAITLRLPKELHEKLKKQAHENYMVLNVYLLQTLKEALKK